MSSNLVTPLLMWRASVVSCTSAVPSDSCWSTLLHPGKFDSAYTSCSATVSRQGERFALSRGGGAQAGVRIAGLIQDQLDAPAADQLLGNLARGLSIPVPWAVESSPEPHPMVRESKAAVGSRENRDIRSSRAVSRVESKMIREGGKSMIARVATRLFPPGSSSRPHPTFLRSARAAPGTSSGSNTSSP